MHYTPNELQNLVFKKVLSVVIMKIWLMGY